MSTSKKALRSVKAFLQPLQAVIDLEDEIEQAGSLENLIAERRRALADLDTQVGQLGAKLAEAEVERVQWIESGKVEAAAVLTKAEGRTPGIVDEAKAQAAAASATIMAAAKAEADAIIAGGRDEAQRIVAAAQEQRVAIEQQAQARVVAADAAAGVADRKRGEANADVAAAEKRLAAVNAEIDRLRNRFTTA